MEPEQRKSGKSQLALALARGISPGKWAKTNGVTRMTAYRWAKEPEVRKAVETHRRNTIDLAVGEMTTHFRQAAEIIYKTATEGDTPSLRFRAARAIFTDMITVSKYSGLEARLLEVEETLEPKKAAGVGTNPWQPAPGSYGMGANPPAVRQDSPGGAGAG